MAIFIFSFILIKKKNPAIAGLLIRYIVNNILEKSRTSIKIEVEVKTVPEICAKCHIFFYKELM